MIPFDPGATLHFVVNAASGRQAADEKRAVIEQALAAAGRRGEIVLCEPAGLVRAAERAAAAAASESGAVVAVGGDGTLNTVAQAAHARGCAMGALPQGTFNYFARLHGIPDDPEAAALALTGWHPQPVQVGRVNERVFLVNASLGLFAEVLEDREAWKARWGRSRVVALGAMLATMLGEQRRLRLHVELAGETHDVRTQTLFVGNNRMQLEQVGLPPVPENGRVAAVMLRPIGSWAMLGLLLRGAFGRLGEADTVLSFEFQQMVVRPSRKAPRRLMKVACDGEVLRLRAPLVFGVAPTPLWLLKP